MARYRIKADTSSRASEAAVQSTAQPAPTYAVKVADRGRVVLPADIRRHLAIREGDTLVLMTEPDGSVRVLSRTAIIRRMRGAFKHLATGRSIVDELIAERRREAKMEDEGR